MTSRRDVRRLFGDLDDSKVVAVLDVGPTLVELEEAASYLGLLPENRRSMSAKAERIVGIVTAAKGPVACDR